MRARLLADFDPGTATTASSGAVAVGAGQWIGGRISERVLYRLSGGLFLAFGLLSLWQAIG